ncbi:hypothetical protein B0H14DRAFT_2559696 [Mycena olivaceomarginata]|nr:hypothetical protein B0H14DRAFT_2559696 [Mycena olivaceomarginata]
MSAISPNASARSSPFLLPADCSSAFMATIGRPRGSKNQPSHNAGGFRPGSGPKRNTTEGVSSSEESDAEAQPRAPSVRERREIRGNGISNLAPMFLPKPRPQSSSTTQDADQNASASNSEGES